jgi:hypothetical protein
MPVENGEKADDGHRQTGAVSKHTSTAGTSMIWLTDMPLPGIYVANENRSVVR